MVTVRFDFNETLKAIQSGKAMSGKNGVLAPLIKQLTEVALKAEIDSHMTRNVTPNYKNRESRKAFKISKARSIWRHIEIVQVLSILNLSRNTKPVSAMKSSRRYCRCMAVV